MSAGHRLAPLRQPSEPIFNVPAVVSAVLALLVAIHAIRAWAITPELDSELLWLFAFVPFRYDSAVIGLGSSPGRLSADVWTFVAYALLHGSWSHLGLN